MQTTGENLLPSFHEQDSTFSFPSCDNVKEYQIAKNEVVSCTETNQTKAKLSFLNRLSDMVAERSSVLTNNKQVKELCEEEKQEIKQVLEEKTKQFPGNEVQNPSSTLIARVVTVEYDA